MPLAPAAGPVRAFGRRFLAQLLVSGAAMVALNLASSLDIGWRLAPGAAPELPAAAAAPAADTPPAAPAAGPAHPAAAYPTLAGSQRGDRLPVWRTAALAAPAKVAEAPTDRPQIRRVLAEMVDDVILFDQCRPGCESRDPFLLANAVRPAAAAAQPAVAAAPGDFDATPPAAPAERGVVGEAVARSGRLLRGVGNLVGW